MPKNFDYVFEKFCTYLLNKAKYEDVSIMNYYNLLKQMKEELDEQNKNWNELEKWIEQGIKDGKESDDFINGMRFVSVKRQYFQMFLDKLQELKGDGINEKI